MIFARDLRGAARKIDKAIDDALDELERELEHARTADTNGERALAIANAELVKLRLASLVQLRRQIRKRA